MQVVNNGQVIGDLQFNRPKSYANSDFDYDHLEGMKNILNTKFHQMPNFANYKLSEKGDYTSEYVLQFT